MSELTNILNQLKELGFVLNPPASQDQINYLRSHLGFISDPRTQFEGELPEDIIELYRHHNGMPYSRNPANQHGIPLFDMRLMSIEEAVQYHRLMFWAFDTELRETFLKDCRFLWVDNQSNAMGIYISGLLKGKVFIWNHEYSDWSPRFRSLESMYKQWRYCAQLNLQDSVEKDPVYAIFSWQGQYPHDLMTYTDYPLLVSTEFDSEDFALAESLIERAQNTQNTDLRQLYAQAALNLYPLSAGEKLVTFLDNEDMYVQAKAADLLGWRRYSPAVDALGRVAFEGMHNGITSAVIALGIIGTAEAEAKIIELIPKMGRQKYLITASLKRLGYQIKQIAESRQAYRKSPDDEWTEF